MKTEGQKHNGVAAVVVHFGQHAYTNELLSRLNVEASLNTIIVVLHSDYNGTRPEGCIFLEEANKGYAAGINLAVRHLQQALPEVDTVLAMNPDLELRDGMVASLLQTHERESASATFPSIREGNLVLNGYVLGRYGTLHRDQGEAHLFPGTFFVFSIAAWEKVGGLNEQYFHYFEDLDFCEKLYRQNSKIVHVSETVVKHVGKSGDSYASTSLPRYAVRNHLLFMQQYGRMNSLSFMNICIRHFLYLFRWPSSFRGIRQWYAGIREFQDSKA